MMSEKPRVFGIGWAKTGTTSLGDALVRLGYRHVGSHLGLVTDVGRGDLTRICELADANSAFEDWPWILVYREMAERYPDARFVLTLRDEAAMLRSYRRMVAQEWRRHPDIREIRRIIYGFDTELGSDDAFIERVRRHNAEVRAYVADQPERLLEMEIAAGDGWEKLCGFLGEPIPDEPFPQANAAASRSQWKTPLREALVTARLTVWRARVALGGGR